MINDIMLIMSCAERGAAVQLYAHNQAAYEAMVPMLETCCRATVIHPTGTGKSFLASQLIEDHSEARFL